LSSKVNLFRPQAIGSLRAFSAVGRIQAIESEVVLLYPGYLRFGQIASGRLLKIAGALFSKPTSSTRRSGHLLVNLDDLPYKFEQGHRVCRVPG
jgi:hypothetical protein